MADTENLVAEIEALGAKMQEAEASIAKRFIGQKKVVDLVLSTDMFIHDVVLSEFASLNVANELKTGCVSSSPPPKALP